MKTALLQDCKIFLSFVSLFAPENSSVLIITNNIMSKDPVAAAAEQAPRQRSDRLLILFIFSTMLVAGSNIVMYHRMSTLTDPSLVTLYNANQEKSSMSLSQRSFEQEIITTGLSSNSSKLAGLHCAQHGGPSDDFATQEMVYWSDLPTDALFKSPFYDPHKYLTFEPDHGGWNNIRMGMFPLN